LSQQTVLIIKKYEYVFLGKTLFGVHFLLGSKVQKSFHLTSKIYARHLGVKISGPYYTHAGYTPTGPYPQIVLFSLFPVLLNIVYLNCKRQDSDAKSATECGQTRK
jgi:hypothetical protein